MCVLKQGDETERRLLVEHSSRDQSDALEEAFLVAKESGETDGIFETSNDENRRGRSGELLFNNCTFLHLIFGAGMNKVGCG